MLSARSLPKKGNLLGDLLYVLSDAAKRLSGVFAPPSLPNFSKATEENVD
jgi:hypothetical protein